MIGRRLAAHRQRFPFVPAHAAEVVAVLPRTVGVDELLGRLAAREARARDDLVGGSNLTGGSGGRLGRFVELGGEFLKANLERRYATRREGLDRELARELGRTELDIYHPRRVWFLARGLDRAFWALTLTPRLETLRERFNREFEVGAVTGAWDLYLQAFRITFAAAGRGALLDCNPNNFGIDGDRLFYIDDDVGDLRRGGAAFVSQALLRLREYPAPTLQVRLRFLERLVAAIEELDLRDLLRWGIRADLESRHFWPAEPELHEPLERLRHRLEQASWQGRP